MTREHNHEKNSTHSRFGYFVTDLIKLAKYRNAVTHIALGDIRARYHRSLLGPLWIVLGLGIGSFGLGYLWSKIWDVPPGEIIPQITKCRISTKNQRCQWTN